MVGNADVQIRYCCWVEAVFKSVCSCFDCPIPARGQQFYQEMAEVRSVFHDVLNISLFI